MLELTITRALHVLAIVHWIGGVSLVTLVILPAVRRFAVPERRLETFEAIEGRFAFQARLSVTLAGATGFWMTHRLGAWGRYLEVDYWWMHAMTALWLLFTIILFVAEPLFLHAWFRRRASAEPDATFALVLNGHRILLALALVTVGASVLGAHGVRFG